MSFVYTTERAVTFLNELIYELPGKDVVDLTINELINMPLQSRQVIFNNFTQDEMNNFIINSCNKISDKGEKKYFKLTINEIINDGNKN